MNAMTMLTVGQPLADPGGMANANGFLEKANLMGQDSGFMTIMTKLTALTAQKNSSGQVTMGAQTELQMNGDSNVVMPASTQQMPEEQGLLQLAVLVHQLPAEIQQMLIKAVEQGDIEQLQMVLQRIQDLQIPQDMPVVDKGDPYEVDGPSLDTPKDQPMTNIQEAHKLPVAVWLMYFLGQYKQDLNSRTSFSEQTQAGIEAVSKEGQAVIQDNPLAIKTDLSFEPRVQTGNQEEIGVSGVSSLSIFLPVKSGNSDVLGLGVVSSSDSGQQASLSVFPPGLLEALERSSKFDGQPSLYLPSVLAQLITDGNGVKDNPASSTIAITDSSTLSAGTDSSGGGNTAFTHGIKEMSPAESLDGLNQEKSAQESGKQAVFADLKESLHKLYQEAKNNSNGHELPNEPNLSVQTDSKTDTLVPQASEQNTDDQASDTSIPSQQISSHSRIGQGEQVVIKRNVPVDGVTKEVVGILAKDIEYGQISPKRVVLYLDPPDLGRVRVNMVLDSGNQLSVHFLAERTEVRNILEGHMEQLRGQLVQKGLDISQLRVEAGRFADFASLDQGFQQNTPQERWASFKGDWHGMVSAKNMAEEEAVQVSQVLLHSNSNGRLHLII